MENQKKLFYKNIKQKTEINIKGIDMYAIFNKNEKKVSAFAEIDDRCYLCKHNANCPLINAISTEQVVLRYESIKMLNCPLYTEI